jgi:hypothetical protein
MTEIYDKKVEPSKSLFREVIVKDESEDIEYFMAFDKEVFASLEDGTNFVELEDFRNANPDFDIPIYRKQGRDKVRIFTTKFHKLGRLL